ncbi:MAG: PilZ domain-containing protein [Kiritimatiellae bacterium]|nr:PilZ domain-containing protein [Kiritimatiellia bacterium]
MPIQVQPGDSTGSLLDGRLRDIGQGGVGLTSGTPLQPGATCTLQFPVLNYPNAILGRVVWCKPEDSGYSAGLQFIESAPYSHARLVVDICHIEFYRRDQRARLGRELNHAEATHEWRQRAAASPAAR